MPSSPRRGLVLRARRRLRAARRAAPDRRQRGGEPARRRGACAISSSGAPPMPERLGPPRDDAAVRAPRDHRLRADRLVDRARRAAPEPRAHDRRGRPRRGGARAGARARPRRRGDAPIAAAGVRGADLVILCVPVGACGAVAAGDRGRRCKPGAIVSDVGSVKASVIAQVQPHLPDGRAFRAGPSGRRHRVFRARRRLRDAVPQPLVHPDAARGHGRRGGRAGARLLGGARRQRRDHDAAASRPRARHHQPRAASHRLQHRRHGGRSRDGDAVGGDQVLGRRLSRLHPHRRLRPDHVARRLPAQQGGGARDARPLQRGHRAARRAPSAGATATSCSTSSPAPARSAAASSPRPGDAGAGFRPAARRTERRGVPQ